jgi:glycosyltransferase involved in cell wall biosynthesis
MYRDKKIAVVVPAHNEAKLIGKVLETMPDYVDRIYVVDDKSRDKTIEKVKSYQDLLKNRLCLIENKRNMGVGGAIITGYKAALNDAMDITAVMAGDAQMDPKELSSLLDPIIHGECDYVKGNRLFTGEAWNIIPRVRYFGNAFLSLLTKIASGYWHIADFQCGYTAISFNALKMLQLEKLYKRYGFPNHMLVELNIYHVRVKDVPVTPIYGIGEKSGIRYHKVVPTLSWLLVKCFFWRMKEKYVIRDFHPLVFFYILGVLSSGAGFLFGLLLIMIRIFYGPVTGTSAIFSAFLIIAGLQCLFFAMWFDMEYYKELK